jgi:hypothetical protein
MLNAAVYHAEGGVYYSYVRVDAHPERKIWLRLAPVAVEEKAVVEIPVAGENLLDGLGGLMNRVIIA